MTHTTPCMLAQVDAAIEQIDKVKQGLDNAFIGLQDATQEQLDRVIEEQINPYINAKLADLRQSLISSLQEQYKTFLAFSETLAPINNASPTDLSSVIEFCLAVKDFIIGAYNTLMQFMTLLPEHLTRLTASITSIAAYTPPVQGLNFDKLNIQMQPITMADITGS